MAVQTLKSSPTRTCFLGQGYSKLLDVAWQGATQSPLTMRSLWLPGIWLEVGKAQLGGGLGNETAPDRTVLVPVLICHPSPAQITFVQNSRDPGVTPSTLLGCYGILMGTTRAHTSERSEAKHGVQWACNCMESLDTTQGQRVATVHLHTSRPPPYLLSPEFDMVGDSSPTFSTWVRHTQTP